MKERKKYNQQLLKPREMLSLLSQDSTQSQKKRAKWSSKQKSWNYFGYYSPTKREKVFFFNWKYSSLKNKTEWQSSPMRKSHVHLLFFVKYHLLISKSANQSIQLKETKLKITWNFDWRCHWMYLWVPWRFNKLTFRKQ